MTGAGAADLQAFTDWALEHGMNRVEVNMTLMDVWLLLANLQLSCTHPNVAGRPLESELRSLGLRLEALIAALCPAPVAALAHQGWDRNRDRPARS